MAANLLFQPTANPIKWKQCYWNRVRFRPQPVQFRATFNQIDVLQSRRSITTTAKSDSSCPAEKLQSCPKYRTKQETCDSNAQCPTKGSNKIWKFAAGVVLGGVLMLICRTRPALALAAGRVRATSPPAVEVFNDIGIDLESQSGRYLSARLYSKSILYRETYRFVIYAFALYYLAAVPAVLYITRVDRSRRKLYLYGATFILGFFVYGHACWVTNYDPSTIVKLQVNLSNSGQALQTKLTQIAETADTSTFEGVNSILRETAVAILKHPDCFISASTYVTKKYGRDGAQNYLDQLSLAERIKLCEKLLGNVENLKAESSTGPKSANEIQDECIEVNANQLDIKAESLRRQTSANEIQDEYMEVTILVALKAKHYFPTINSWDELKKVLQLLTSIDPDDGIYPYVVEVLWSSKSSSSTGNK